MKKLFYYTIAAFLFVGLFSSCEKDDDEDLNPYVGTWKNEVGANLSGLQEQLTFIFTNTTFEVEVYQGLTANQLVLATAVKGDITNSTDTKLTGEITGVKLGDTPDYIEKESNPESFASLFSVGLGTMLSENFTASYVIVGNIMTLTIPVKSEDGVVDMPFILTKQ